MTHALQAALAPASVAILGASDNPDKVGGRPIHFMKRFGFRGGIYPINPARDTVQGLPAWGSLAALPVVPELAVIVVPGQAAVDAVRECAARGVRTAIVIASGFGETGEAGSRLQQTMVEEAARAGMRLIGPNSQGFANFANGAVASFSTMFIEYPPCDGPVAVVSQSGAFAAAAYGLMRAAGLGVRHVHATGNEADVTVADVAELVADDPQVGLLLLYMEHVASPAVLARAARKAKARGLPVLAIKSGRSADGRRMVASHTGSIAGEDRQIDAFMARHGILRLRGLGELARLAPLLAGGLRARGERLIVISNSGASCVMAADAAATHGLVLADPSEPLRTALRSVLPVFATSVNPIDLTGALLSDSALFTRVLDALAHDAGADLVHIDIPVAGKGYDLAGFAAAAAHFGRHTGKPLTISAWQPSVAGPFRAAGLPVFATIDEALATLAQLARCTRLRERPITTWDDVDADAARYTGAGAGFRNEADSLRLLERAGLPLVPWRHCLTVDAALAAAQAIGMPVVLKACSAALPHKSDHALVSLGLADAPSLEAAAEKHAMILQGLGIEPEGMIVAAMCAGRRELMLGARFDAAYGCVVVVGDGGRYVEAMPDTALLQAPFDADDVLEALRSLRIWPVLAGTRGEPALDVQAFAQAALALGRLVHGAQGAIASVDANPVMVLAAGEGVRIADALVELRG